MKTQQQRSKAHQVYEFGFRKTAGNRNDAPSLTQVEDCKKWLLKYAKKKRLPEERCLNSYYLKHVVEDAIGQYVTNGAFIQAAIELGFQYSSIVGPNAFFHIELRLPEDEWRRISPEGFSKWLFQQEHLEFAQKAMLDQTWPRKARRFIDFWRYLNSHGGWDTSDEDQLSDAWERCSGQMAPRPDWIDTDVVYDRQCDFISLGDPYPDAFEGMTHLYALVETENPHNFIRVRYVGQTISPRKRLREHILRPGSFDRVMWMGQLLHGGRYPQMAIFYVNAALSMANALEKAAIYAFSESETHWDDSLDGFPPLDDALLNIDK
ncbi:MAG TPA: hypothetical protein DC047_06385 [Blastocatellia bacterium]|nr:hypothetical protein [Blastocatellia bacterium]